MKSEEQLIRDSGYSPVKYSKNNDQEDDMRIDREDDLAFKNDMIAAILEISKKGLRISPSRIGKVHRRAWFCYITIR